MKWIKNNWIFLAIGIGLYYYYITYIQPTLSNVSSAASKANAILNTPVVSNLTSVLSNPAISSISNIATGLLNAISPAISTTDLNTATNNWDYGVYDSTVGGDVNAPDSSNIMTA